VASFDYDVVIVGSGHTEALDHKEKAMSELAIHPFRTVVPSDAIADRSVVTFYVGDRKAAHLCHGSRFDITTGRVIDGRATNALTVYAVQEVEGSAQIRV